MAERYIVYKFDSQNYWEQISIYDLVQLLRLLGKSNIEIIELIRKYVEDKNLSWNEDELLKDLEIRDD